MQKEKYNGQNPVGATCVAGTGVDDPTAPAETQSGVQCSG